MEIINDIEFFPLIINQKENNMYLISKSGDIYSKYYHKLLKQKIDKDGYHNIGIYISPGNRRFYKVAALVLYTFYGNPPEDIIDITTEHIDGNTHNNHISNLMWMERGLNVSTKKNKGIGEQNHESILTEKQVLEICELIQSGYQLNDIAKKYNVDKSTISNIKRKKNWTHLTKGYNFTINKQVGKIEATINRFYIHLLLRCGYTVSKIIKFGFSSSVVHRCKNKQNKSDQVMSTIADIGYKYMEYYCERQE